MTAARRAAGAALASAAATAALAAVLALASAGAAALRGPLLASVPAGDLAVGPPTVPLGPIALRTGRAVDSGLEARLRADPRVRSVMAEVPLRVPARLEGRLLGRAYSSDVAIVGVEAAFLGLGAEAAFDDPGEAGPVPVAVGAALLDLYNVSFAPAHGLPRLTASFLAGRTFDLYLGESSIFGVSAGAGRTIHRRARIAALSDRPGLLGLALPRAFVERTNRAFGASDAPERLHVEAARPGAAEALAAELRASGYDVRTRAEAAAAAARLARLGAAALGLAAVGTAGVAAFGLGAAAAAAALERRAEAEVLHLLARPRAAIVAALAAPVAGAGAAGALVGAAAGAWGAARAWTSAADGLGLPPVAPGAVEAAAAAFALVSASGTLAAFAAAARIVPPWRKR